MSESSIPELVAELAAKSGVARQHARHQLEAMGSAAEDALIEALGEKQEHMRWEAAKALSRIASDRSATALVGCLDDHDTGIRWLAAEALLRTGAGGVEAILVALTQGPKESGLDTGALCEGAHHVFHGHKDKALRELTAPVVEVLRAAGKAEAVPVTAASALNALRSTRS